MNMLAWFDESIRRSVKRSMKPGITEELVQILDSANHTRHPSDREEGDSMNAREILGRMKSVQDTRKITNAILISSTKLRKAKLLEETEPYFYTLQDLIRRILRHAGSGAFLLQSQEEIKEQDRMKGLIVITGDKAWQALQP